MESSQYRAVLAMAAERVTCVYVTANEHMHRYSGPKPQKAISAVVESFQAYADFGSKVKCQANPRAIKLLEELVEMAKEFRRTDGVPFASDDFRDAVLTMFINSVAGHYGIDYALHTSDLDGETR